MDIRCPSHTLQIVSECFMYQRKLGLLTRSTSYRPLILRVTRFLSITVKTYQKFVVSLEVML
jgi:hypothetical protein